MNSSKKVERTFRYGPYGENTKSEGTQTIPAPFGYKGGYHMPGGNKGEGNVSNSLYHFGARYYDPTTGRWTQQDPRDQLGSAMQGDRFLFAGSDPINLSDPSGREILSEAGELAEEGGEAVNSGVEDYGGYRSEQEASEFSPRTGGEVGFCEASFLGGPAAAAAACGGEAVTHLPG